jgi:hypothetical protein
MEVGILNLELMNCVFLCKWVLMYVCEWVWKDVIRVKYTGLRRSIVSSFMKTMCSVQHLLSLGINKEWGRYKFLAWYIIFGLSSSYLVPLVFAKTKNDRVSLFLTREGF